MARLESAALATALLLLACASAPALAAIDAGAAIAASPGLVAGVIGSAGRVFSRLPESGVLLLWGTGLAVVARALLRKPHIDK